MPDSQDQRVFAPAPQTVVFQLEDREVPAQLYNFLDLPVKDALAVYGLEDELRDAKSWPEQIEIMRRILRLLCPKLEQEQLDQLSPRQVQSAISASHGVDPQQPAEAVSPSPSAGSTTRSPGASTGGPET